MKSLVLLTVIAIANGALLGTNKCTTGPSYWCNSFENAQECGATQHCMKKVWTVPTKPSQLATTKDSIPCTFCKDVVNDVKEFLENDQNIEKIEEYLNKACSFMPDDYSQQKCEDISKHYLDEFLTLVNQTVDPQVICQLAHLCQASSAAPVVKPKITESPECTLCKDVVSDVKKFLADNATWDTIRTYLKDACQFMPDDYSKSQCNDIADHYLNEFIDAVNSIGDPEVVCEKFKLCQPSLKTLFTQHVKESGTNDLCADCKTAVADAKKMIEDKDTQAELKADMVELCEKFGGQYTMECKLLVDTMFDKMIAAIDAQLTDQLCEDMKLCTSLKLKLNPVRFVKAVFTKMVKSNAQKKRVSKVAAGVKADACTMCEEAVNYLKLFVNNNSTEQEVQDMLENEVCSQLGELSSMCKVAVEQYFPQLWSEFIEKLDPKTLCTDLGLCKSVTDKVKVRASVECVVCEFIMEKLEGLLDDNATEAEIVAAVEKVCSILPSSVEQECDDLIEEYGTAIIHLLVDDLPPSTICSFIGLCSSGDSQYMKAIPKLGDEACTMCKLAMSYVKSFITKDSTEQDIMNALDKVCNFLSGDMAQECNTMVKEYAPMLVKMLADEIDSQKICEAIMLCPTQADGFVHLYKRLI